MHKCTACTRQMQDKGADLMQLVHPLLDRASQTSGVRAATLEHAKLVQGTLPATLALPASAGNKQTVRDVRLFHSYLWALALLGQGNEGRVQGSKMLADAAAKIDEPTSGSKRVTPQAAMPPPPPPSARSSPALSEQRGMRSPLMPAPGAGGGELCVITLPDGKQALFHKATNMVVGMLEAPAADSLQPVVYPDQEKSEWVVRRFNEANMPYPMNQVPVSGFISHPSIMIRDVMKTHMKKHGEPNIFIGLSAEAEYLPSTAWRSRSATSSSPESLWTNTSSTSSQL